MDTTKKEYIENGGTRMHVCCSEHLEIAIDDFVDEFEDAPDLYMLQNVSFTEWSAPEHCEYCGLKAEYLVV
ncbi:CxxH/CxxC protein [Aneurinibacillus tyrosinisolvens]|jgi:CxxH/CxxC protein (TIGR04129 family)|uniref:CxxH/CxxC protein n=1 Tax=Aneurinibacillus tyrosinisolvens TaxID=1443435 RepID=UPI00063F6D74